MADITFVNSAQWAKAGSGTINCDKPSNTQEGDIMFALFMSYVDFPTTTPTGWTRISSNYTNGDYRIWLYYKIAGSSEPSNYSWGSDGNGYTSMAIATYRGGFDTSNPIEVYSTESYSSNDTILRATGISVSKSNSNILFIGGTCYASTSKTFTKPSALDNDWIEDIDNGSSTARQYWTFCHCNWSSSGSTGNIDATISGSHQIKHAFIVSLTPIISGPANLKTCNGLAKESIKTINGLAVGSVKTWNGLA